MAQDFTVDRNSPKWVLGADGYLKEYTTDQAAIEFNPDGSYKGVLVEPESVNEALQSEDLGNATYWTVLRTTIAGDTETDPKGGTNSFLLSETVDNDSHFILTASAHRITVGSGETWTSSMFVKKGDGANAPDIVQLILNGSIFSATNYVNFDISVGGGTSGTVTASSGGTGRIRYYGNGWYRISWTATSTSIGTNASYASIAFCNNNPTATRLPTYAGQTDANVFIWGAQLEESPIATSYIPTTTGAVTRLKDDIYLTSASSLIGQTEGTMFVEVDWQDSGVQQEFLSANDGTNANRLLIYKNTTPELRMLANSNSVQVTNQGESSTAYSGIQKIAFAYKTDDFELYRNGSSISTDTSGSLASLGTLTNVDFAQSTASGSQANMWIRAVALFTTRLSDAECEALTTI